MLNSQFLGQNLHFSIGLVVSLSFFAVAWLYFDAWTNKETVKGFFKWCGLFLLSVSFLIYAIDVPWIGSSVADQDTTVFRLLSECLRIAGYIFVFLAEIMDPLQQVPTHESSDEEPKDKSTEEDAGPKKPKSIKVAGIVTLPMPVLSVVKVLPTVGAATVGLMYLRRATKGLERHLRPLAVAFGVLALFELLSQAYLLRASSNVVVSQLTATYGPIWLLENIVLLVAGLLLGRWVWRYLTKRFMSQLFMIFVSSIIAVFL